MRQTLLGTAVTIVAVVTFASMVSAQPAPRSAATPTVSGPVGEVLVPAGQDWATRTFQKPMTMTQWTDIGWWAYSADQPSSDLTSVGFSACTGDATSSCFKATTATSGANLWLLESGWVQSSGTGTSSRYGKTGDNYAIDASTYKTVAFRMRLTTPSDGSSKPNGSCYVADPPGLNLSRCLTSFMWDKNSLYDGLGHTYSNGIKSYDGWGIYYVDLTTHGLDVTFNTNPWTGSIGDLRFNLPTVAGANVEIDWVRLVPTPATSYTITWSGFAASVDIYLDNNNVQGDGNLGFMVDATPNNDTVVSYNIWNPSNQKWVFRPGLLAPGDYYVLVCNNGADPTTSSSCRHSSGYYRVNDAPTITFTSPSPEGSADDFATVQLNQAWNMTSTSQLDHTVYQSNVAATTISAVNEAGTSLGTVNVIQGTSPSASQTGTRNPQLYFLGYDSTSLGRYKTIDTSRYHIMTLEMGIGDAARDISSGSRVRVGWQIKGEEPNENVSSRIVFNTRTGVNVMSKIITSLRTCSPSATEWNHCLKLEADTSVSKSSTGWSGQVESFRVDPHLFPGATTAYVKSLKIAANERTVNNSFTLSWSYTDTQAQGTPTLALYYDTDLDPSTGQTLITSGLNPATTSSYSWNTAGVPNGTYYIYAVVSDGLDTNATYSRWPIIVDSATTSALLPQISLDKRQLTFTGADAGRLITPGQTVNVTITGTNAASVAWRATASDPAVNITPSTGTGNGTFTVALQSSSSVPNNLQGDFYVTVQEAVAGTTSNSGQFVRVLVQMDPNPAGPTVITAASDWATRLFQKPIDMTEYTDISWWPYAADLPLSNLNNVAFGACTGGGSSSTCFKATTGTTDSNLWILETGNPPGSRVGKTGDNFPIDANTYQTVVVRMRIASGSCPYLNPPTTCTSSFYWDKGSLYDSPVTGTRSASFFTYDGWQIYYIDLTKLGYSSSSPLTPWAGTIGDLRLNLTAVAGVPIEIDWIRLVPNTASTQTITWGGFPGNVDIYLDDNNTVTDGNLGMIVKAEMVGAVATWPSRNLSGGTYTFQPGGLAAGTYYVEICPTGTDPTSNASGCRYSTGYYRVNDTPGIVFTSPSPEGSSDDFATVQLNQPWDMTSVNQIDAGQQYYITGLAATTVAAVNEAGASIGTVNVLQGTSKAKPEAGFGDPYMYFLFYAGDGKGRFKKIDSSRYHILTLEAGVPDKPRDINDGSIIRVIWQVEGEATKENVSNDLVFQSRAGVNVMSKIITSMRTCAPTATEWNHCLRLETDAGASPSTSGWIGNIENFRFDPHEYSTATPFYIKRIKLAANEKSVNNQYTIQWTYTDSYAASTPTLALYYDTDLDPTSNTVLIVNGLNPATASSYTWNTASVPNGTYYIYAVVNDGLNTNAAYSRWPIIVNSATTTALLPRLSLNRRRLDTAGSDNGRVVTPPQTVVVDVIGTGAASVGWKVTASDPSVLVSPSTGVGPGSFTVTMATSTIYPYNLVGDYYVKVEESTPGTTSNSAQYIRVFFTMHAKEAVTAPFGNFDTPADASSGLQGSFAVTGWTLDDLGVTKVDIWRDLIAGEDPSHAYTTDPNHPAKGKVYIADGLFVNGSRPDIEAAYPQYPYMYRSGWGYLLLSWGLEGQKTATGPVTYKLYAYAYDVDGHSTLLGTKTISVDNAHANKPFGAIDTPSYGGTVSGGFWNFGWGLTPNSSPVCTIRNGRVYMSVDSGPLQQVNYGDPRPDIAASFGTFSNGNNSGGAYYIDSTQFSNGMHQIGWLVYDDCSRGDGVGSRFFNIQNASARPATDASAQDQIQAQAEASRGATAPAARRVSEDAVLVRRDLLGAWTRAVAGADGVRVIEVAQDGRLEVQLPLAIGPYAGYQDVRGQRRPLPLGSTLDTRSAIFYWQPGPGFIGAFNLTFTSGDGVVVPLRIVVGPPVRLAIDTPAPGAIVTVPFDVAGWATDLASDGGTGVDAVHVWAYPVGGDAPIRLGAARLGDPRPDVAAIYGTSATSSAYTLVVDQLPAGTWDLVVYARRAKTQAFDAASTVRITVR